MSHFIQIHAVGNNLDKIQLMENSPLKKYFESVESLDLLEKGLELSRNADIRKSHELHAQQGQTTTPSLNENVENHFVALVERNGRIYQLNGGKNGPVDHGPSTQETFLYDAAAVCRQFIAKHPDCHNYSVLAILKAFD